ncbi:LOW QUALITY PROTEIN: glycerol-3-phosphate phosphatase-like [Gigantopelta aegis]|uniref:LOW QUALITY PROTEIN: glycerol-3-phosphate phosphatase-like n=1 Tax=Gigantopelta aegis TaxID=1735272 RepID=UPI001B88882F|nr:LOW QUALITY PROTEIN: glycerol-3-phosphate phosphatase-like [Gigantopelta aegis]
MGGNAEPVPGAKKALAFIRSMGKKVCFITNNSSKSRAEHLKKIHQLGFEAYENEVYHSTGSIVSAVRVAAEREPIVVGKPWSPMFDCIAQNIDLDPARTLLIGDRLDTDILFGRHNKLKTLLVLTGIQCETDLSSCPENKFQTIILTQ